MCETPTFKGELEDLLIDFGSKFYLKEPDFKKVGFKMNDVSATADKIIHLIQTGKPPITSLVACKNQTACKFKDRQGEHFVSFEQFLDSYEKGNCGDVVFEEVVNESMLLYASQFIKYDGVYEDVHILFSALERSDEAQRLINDYIKLKTKTPKQ